MGFPRRRPRCHPCLRKWLSKRHILIFDCFPHDLLAFLLFLYSPTSRQEMAFAKWHTHDHSAYCACENKMICAECNGKHMGRSDVVEAINPLFWSVYIGPLEMPLWSKQTLRDHKHSKSYIRSTGERGGYWRHKEKLPRGVWFNTLLYLWIFFLSLMQRMGIFPIRGVWLVSEYVRENF
jgi:hypothetical protein